MKPLNPIMAALVAASVGAMPLRTLASGTDQTAAAPAGRAVASPDDALSRLVELADKAETKEKVRADAATRIGDFLLGSGPGGAKFVGAGVDGVALRAMVVDWTKKKDATSLATLYFVLGPGSSAPSWAASDAKLALFKPTGRWEAVLRSKLEHWTKAEKQIRGGMEAGETGALIDEASVKAPEVFQERRSAGEVETDIGNNDNTRVDPPGAGRSGLARPFDPSTNSATFEQMYVDGAEVRRIHKPGEPARLISIRVHTVREADGSLVNKLGVYDITDRNRPIGQTFPLTNGKTGPFRLNDIDKGTRNYELDIQTDPKTGERHIFFGRPGTKPGEAGVISGVSVEELLLRRADAAAGMNSAGRADIVSVGGREFYALPQGGKYASILLLPKAVVDARSRENASELRPELYADIGQRDREGRTVPVSGKPHLGSTGGKEYHLELSPGGKWEVKDGPGDKPKPEAVAGDTTAGATTPGGATGGPGQTLAELETYLRGAGYSVDENNNNRLAENLKGKYRILHKGSGDELEFTVLTPRDVASGGQLAYKSIRESLTDAEERRLRELSDKGEGASAAEKQERDRLHQKKAAAKITHKMERAYFAGAYLVLQFDTQFQYLDLSVPDRASGFKLVGQATRSKDALPSLIKFTRVDAAMIAAKDHLAAPEEYLTSVPARVREAARGDFEFNSSKAGGSLIAVVIADGVSTQVWPEVKVVDRAATGGDYASAGGPGNVFEGRASGQHSDGDLFPPKFSLNGADSTKVPELTFPGAALYKQTREGTDIYHFVYAFTALVNPETKSTATYRVQPFELFNKTNQLPTAKIEGRGLLDLGPDQAIVYQTMGGSLLVGSTRAKGAYAVWREDATKGSENLKYKGRNCAGLVLWWGMTAEQAQDACKAEKIQ